MPAFEAIDQYSLPYGTYRQPPQPYQFWRSNEEGGPETSTVAFRETSDIRDYYLEVVEENAPISRPAPSGETCEILDSIHYGDVRIRLLHKILVDVRRIPDRKWQAKCLRLSLPPATDMTGHGAFERFKIGLVEEIERLRQTAPHEMSNADFVRWDELSRIVDWTRYHLENPSLRFCHGRVCGWRRNFAEIQWILSPFADEPEPTYASIPKTHLPSSLWNCSAGEEFEARIKPPRRTYSVCFKVRERSLQIVREAGVPEDILARLNSITGLPFGTLQELEGKLRTLVSSQEFDKYGDQILREGAFCEADPNWYVDDQCEWVEAIRIGVGSGTSAEWLERLARVVE